MTPGWLDVTHVARLLHVPIRFVYRLAAHHVLDAPDAQGRFSAAGLRRAIDAHPWLTRLDRPLSLWETTRINPTLTIPDTVGVVVAGVRYAPLRVTLDALFDRLERTHSVICDH